MKQFLGFCLLLLFAFAMTSCGRTASDQSLGLAIGLNTDSSAILIKGLPLELMNELEQNPSESIDWRHFFAVYEDVNDTEMQDLAKPLEGTYEIRERMISFRPKSAFQKGQQYIVYCYIQELRLDVLTLFKAQGWQQQQRPLEYRFRY